MARNGQTFTLDDAVFKKKIRDLARRHGLDEKEFVKEQGGFLARDLARSSPPYAKFPSGKGSSIGSAKDKRAGEDAIHDDLCSIFRAKDQTFINFCAKNFGLGLTNQPMRGKGGKEYRIQYNRICMSLVEMGQWHRSQQNARGRVRWNRTSIETAWVSEKLFKKYYMAEKKKVGIAKASLAAGAIALNPKIKVPAWVKRHFGRVSGAGLLDARSGSPTARIHAKAAGLQHIGLKTFNLVKKGRMKAMESRLKFLFKKSAKKAGFKVRG